MDLVGLEPTTSGLQDQCSPYDELKAQIFKTQKKSFVGFAPTTSKLKARRSTK